MLRSGLFPIVLASAFTAACCVPLDAQTTIEEAPPASLHVKQVPQAPLPGPFSVVAGHEKSASSIDFRPPVQMTKMTKSDSSLVVDAGSSIAEHAASSGFDLQQGQWSYQQVVCPGLPNHIFLQYMRNNGAGDITVFSASIPRAGEGRVRIIPILRRGYSLFSPAPVNALTIQPYPGRRASRQFLRLARQRPLLCGADRSASADCIVRSGARISQARASSVSRDGDFSSRRGSHPV